MRSHFAEHDPIDRSSSTYGDITSNQGTQVAIANAFSVDSPSRDLRT